MTKEANKRSRAKPIPKESAKITASIPSPANSIIASISGMVRARHGTDVFASRCVKGGLVNTKHETEAKAQVCSPRPED